MKELMNGCMHLWMEKISNGWIFEWANKWINEWIKKWAMNKWLNESFKNGIKIGMKK